MPSDITYCREITESDINEMAQSLRIPERDDLARTYSPVQNGMLTCWVASKYARVIRVDGTPVAMFGVAEDEDGVNVPWLIMTTEALMERPIRIMREAKQKLSEIRQQFPGKMANFVPADDEQAIHMIEALGFTVRRDVEIERDGWPYYYFVMEAN